MKTAIAPLMETLESRTLFSVIPTVPALAHRTVLSSAAVATPSPGTTVSGVTLNLTADVPFMGSVGFVSSPSIAPLQATVSIAWGDGGSSTGTLQAATLNGVSGYDIIGTHTYTLARTDSITTTITLRPISVPGQPTPEFIVLLPAVNGTAIVSPPAVNSSGGVTLDEVAGKSFAADMGQFSTIAPAKGVAAVIHWGDGIATPAKITAAGVSGIDVLNFDVVGRHRYRKPGAYAVRIVATEPSLDSSGKPRQIAKLLTNVIVVAR